MCVGAHVRIHASMHMHMHPHSGVAGWVGMGWVGWQVFRELERFGSIETVAMAPTTRSAIARFASPVCGHVYAA